jgi:hypothetical protein
MVDECNKHALNFYADLRELVTFIFKSIGGHKICPSDYQHGTHGTTDKLLRSKVSQKWLH